MVRHSSAIRAVALDIDGTITDERQRISTDAISAVRAVERGGIPVMLTTGNVMCVAHTVATYIGTSGPVVAENGGVIRHNGEYVVLADRTYCDEAFEHLVRVMSARGIAVRKTLSDAYRQTEVALDPALDAAEIKAALAGWDVAVSSTGYAHHLHLSTINKFTGIERACAFLGISPGDVLAIGDSENDHEMVAGCGRGGTVANGFDTVKAQADYVSRKKYGPGAVDVLRHFLPELFVK